MKRALKPQQTLGEDERDSFFQLLNWSSKQWLRRAWFPDELLCTSGAKAEGRAKTNLTSERNKQRRNINRSIILMVICSVMCGWREKMKQIYSDAFLFGNWWSLLDVSRTDESELRGPAVMEKSFKHQSSSHFKDSMSLHEASKRAAQHDEEIVLLLRIFRHGVHESKFN